MSYVKKSKLLLKQYEHRLRSGSDTESALHEAIDTTFASAADDRKADLFARILPLIAEYTGIARRIAVTSALRAASAALFASVFSNKPEATDAPEA